MLEEKEKIREKENHRVFKQLLSTFWKEKMLLKMRLKVLVKILELYQSFSMIISKSN